MVMSTEKKEVLKLAFFEGLTPKQAAKKAGVTSLTAIQWLARWRDTGEVPDTLRCVCGKLLSHRGICPRPKAAIQPQSEPALQTAPGEPHNEEEWGKLLVEIRVELLHYSIKKLGSKARAEDLVSQTIEKAWRSRLMYKKDSNFRAWIYTVLSNFTNGEFRRTKKLASLDDIEVTLPEAVTIPERSTDEALLNQILVKIVRLLPNTRDVCLAVWFDGKTYEETASKYGISVGTLKSQLWRSRQVLKGIIGEGAEENISSES